MPKLSEIRRGVEDPSEVAAFFTWLLDIHPEKYDDRFRFACGNGTLVVHGDAATPVSIGLADAGASPGADPDGVPVFAADPDPTNSIGAGVRLDHVRLNCADLAAVEAYYRRLGFSLTWSGRGDDERDGLQEASLDGATWLHLSGEDGYLSLSQADWQDFGRHNAASGPPRFIHIGLAVDDLAAVADRLDRPGVEYLQGAPAVGRNVYLNDPEGQAALGSNIEIIEYHPGMQRSGQPPQTPASTPAK